MATIDSVNVIQRLIKNGGRYDDGPPSPDDPPAAVIVEYMNVAGYLTHGVTFMNEAAIYRYMEETQFVRSPRIIWKNPLIPQ